MLALKDRPKASQSRASRELLNLPDELLDLIISHVYADNGSFARDLLPASRTCHRLRKATAPILFHSVSIRATRRYVDRRTFNILLNFDYAPYTFASYIRHLKQDDSYVFRADGCEDLKLSNELVRAVTIQGLRALRNVRTISVGCCNSALIQLMQEAFPNKAFRVRIEGCTCSRWTTGMTSLATVTALCKSNVQHRFEIAVDSGMRYCALEPFMSEQPEKVQVISWTCPLPDRALMSSLPPFANFSALEELHLRSTGNSSFDGLESALPEFRLLKRLSLVAPGFCSAALKVMNQLQSLESLRLNSPVERIFHAHLRNHSFEGLPYLHLPKLKSLEIRYISRYLSIEHIVPPNLTHLRLEYHNRNDRLTSYDLRWIARNTPNLECLEMNVGSLANLWHPTAIAGVDVDMDVYGMFEALSAFPNLQTIRLFPSYWQSAAGYLHFVQPVSDEQAVRIFHHLRLNCLKLRSLIISNSYLDYRSRNEVFSRGLTGEPVKWVVRPWGSKTLLLTHEAKKQYHLEQIWEGERRLTITTVRHNGRRLHFDELQEWSMPMYELPFDEPRPCAHSEPREQA